MNIAARLVADVARNHPELLAPLLTEELPWIHWLPESDRARCAEDLLSELVAGADTGILEPFARTLAAWRSTAEVWSDPELARRLHGPFTGDGKENPPPSSFTVKTKRRTRVAPGGGDHGCFCSPDTKTGTLARGSVRIVVLTPSQPELQIPTLAFDPPPGTGASAHRPNREFECRPRERSADQSNGPRKSLEPARTQPSASTR